MNLFRGNATRYDSLYKVRPVWNSAIHGFQQLRNPPKCVALDEAMIQYCVSCTFT